MSEEEILYNRRRKVHSEFQILKDDLIKDLTNSKISALDKFRSNINRVFFVALVTLVI